MFLAGSQQIHDFAETAIHEPTIQEDRMTVSPQWPNEGSRPPHQPASGLESDDSHRANALPPTLFQLPNLNVERPTSVESVATEGLPGSDRSPTTPQPLGAPVVGQVPFVTGNAVPPCSGVGIDEPVDPSRETLQDSDDEPPTFPTPPAVTDSTQTPATMGRRTESPRRAPVSSDSPAGRSWMDSIGSHGIVVVLLLVVVAAALITGRNSADSGSDGNLADSTEWLDFDEGSDVQLPLPASVIEPSSNTDVTSLVESMGLDNNESTIVRSDAIAEPTGTLENATSLGIPEPQAGFSPGTFDGDPSEQVAASLDVPPDAYLDPTNAQTASAPANKVQFNEYVSGPTSVDVMTAANRIPIGDNSSVLPSLEELAGETTDVPSSPSQSAAMPTGPIRIQTSTPNAIVDWSKHLPLPESTTTATLPSTTK